MKKGNIIAVHNGNLTPKEFDFYPVWCEYYEPKEIDELIQLGENKDFLTKELIVVVESSDGQNHPFYTLPTSSTCAREFLFVSCEIGLYENSYNGYAALVKDEITSFIIFEGNQEFDLYLNEEFCEDNYLTVHALTGRKTNGKFEITYFFKSTHMLSREQGKLTLFCQTKKGGQVVL